MKKALAWIRENGARYGADPDFIVVTGGSAGAHLASLVALTANDAAYQPGFEHVDTSVTACVPMYGVYDWRDRHGFWHRKGFNDLLETRIVKASIEEAPDLYRRGSPMDNIHPARPPFLVVHGDLDSLAPVEEARYFVDLLRRTGDAHVAYAEIPRAQHAFEIFKSLRAQLVIDGIERYLAYVYSAWLRARTARGEASSTPVFAVADPVVIAAEDGAGESASRHLNGSGASRA